MAGLRPFLGGVGLIIVFGIALFMFMIGFIGVNNPSYDVDNDPFVNSSAGSLNLRAEELKSLGDSSLQLIETAEPSPQFLFLIFKSAFYIPLGFLSFLIKSVGTILLILWVSLFGIGGSDFSIIFGVISGLILLTIVILIMRAIRTGETEK